MKICTVVLKLFQSYIQIKGLCEFYKNIAMFLTPPEKAHRYITCQINRSILYVTLVSVPFRTEIISEMPCKALDVRQWQDQVFGKRERGM